ncbi:MAG: PH domain-containing protein [Acidimicrobiia bacterium]
MILRRLRWALLPPPDDILHGYLIGDEQLILVDEPSTGAFLVDAAHQIILMVAVALLTGFVAGRSGANLVSVAGFLVVDVLAIMLVVRRAQAWYTRYALTDFRVIRSWGILCRRMAWIPWSKVTDVSLHQSTAGRILGYATVRIESANEASGFKQITDLRDPHRFHRLIAEIVEAKQGKTYPRWMAPAYASAADTAPHPPIPR